MTVVELKKLAKVKRKEKLDKSLDQPENFKHTDIGPVPKSWHEASIDKVCTLQTGGTPSRKKNEYWDGEIPWIKTGEVDYCVITETEECITQAGLDNSNAKLFPKGTLLVAMYGQGITRGKVALMGIEAATNQACAAITPKKSGELCTDFLYFFLRYRYEALRNRGHGANQKNLSVTLIKLFPVVFPPTVDEQKKIAYVLSKVQDAIATQEQLIQATTELKKALMQKLFTEGLHGEPQKETEIGPIPESWEIISFAKSIEIKKGQVDPKVAPYSDMLHVGPENMESNTGRLVKLKTNKQKKIMSGNYHFTSDDVLYSKIRPYLNKVALPTFEGTCSADMYPLRSKSSFFRREYLFHFFLSDIFVNQTKSFQDRTGIPKINRAQLNMTFLILPSPEAQQKIAQILTLADQKLEFHHKKKSSLSDLFQTLLHQLMTAQIRVHDVDLPGF